MYLDFFHPLLKLNILISDVLITDEDLLVKIMSDELLVVVNRGTKDLDEIRDAFQIKFKSTIINDTDHDQRFCIYVISDHHADLMIFR